MKRTNADQDRLIKGMAKDMRAMAKALTQIDKSLREIVDTIERHNLIAAQMVESYRVQAVQAAEMKKTMQDFTRAVYRLS